MILGAGRALGERIHTNAMLAVETGVAAEWVVAKTGITQRWYTDQSLASLALCAAADAIVDAHIEPAQIGMTVACTFTHDYLFPPLSAKLHHDLGLRGGQFYDLQANCSGFVSALVAVTDRMTADPSLEYALIVGAEKLSPLIDPTDIETAMFFSDGAGAVVVGRGGIVASAFDADTRNYEADRCDGQMSLNGLVTWSQAVKHLPGVVRSVAERAGWGMDTVDLILFHQANQKLLEFLMSRLGLPMERTYTNVESIGNTGAASLPIVISDALHDGRLHGRILIVGIGAGFGFACAALEQEE
jgi:3-oxoacyl-[acyl-carrier-protein] synthase-3